MSIIHSIILAIIEGITEFLPVSSTGHMIIASSFMGLNDDDFTKVFIVSIQLGAILAIIVLYWRNFFQTFSFYYTLLLAFIPAAIMGLLFGKYIDVMLGKVEVVAIMLIFGGIVFLFIDRWLQVPIEGAQLSYRKAFYIGIFQTFAMIPGVSRSAASIIGGLFQKLDRKTAAEFSFFLAVPTMFAATLYKLFDFYIGDGVSFTTTQLSLLGIGNVVAFIVALLAAKTFVTMLTRYGFKMFGYYRIIIGISILILHFYGTKFSII